ncbi:MAG: class I SAM-dependent methyltransferase [Proteobacteria bacterium]|nr:class I SAM-dependent methyltransferase [Pseudomonadota bacterium]
MKDRRKQIVRDAYDAIAQDYLAWSGGSEVRLRQLQNLLARLPQNARVLELGCGAGVPVTKALAERGSVTAVDISPAQIALAEKNVPGAKFLCADMMTLAFSAETFDAVAAFYAITHVPREEHAELFRHIFHWLKPGGIFFASLGASASDDAIEDDWLGKPNFFSHHNAETNLKLLADAGFAPVAHEIVKQDLKGEDAQFLWVMAQKS